MRENTPYLWNLLRCRGSAQRMSIDKESTGMPEINPRRRTTKVNFVMIIAVGLFFVAMGLVAWWVARR